jgi:hypothetical protein
MFAASKTDSASEGYQISRSLRFNSADSAYLNRTVSTTSNRQIFTFSFWCKVGTIGTTRYLYGASINGANEFVIVFDATNEINIYDYQGAYNLRLISAQVFRDPSAWYHFVFAVDTTQATASNRVKMYVNGSQITSFNNATYPSQNYNTLVNSSSTPDNRIASLATNLPFYFNGYVTEFNFIDGQALTPSSFGETNAQTGVWQPKAFSGGAYGTNGFYLNFSDNSNTTAATLGKDYSGNGNNFTPNNFSVTAGAGNDSLVDVPTLYGADTGAGGTVRGNYATFNPLTTTRTITNGNLYTEVNGGGGSNVPISLSMALPTTGKWYWEITAGGPAGGGNGGWDWGIVASTTPNFRLANLLVAGTTGCYGVNGNSGTLVSNGTTAVAGYIAGGIANGDVAQIAYDADTGKLWLGKNNTWGTNGGVGNPAAGTNAGITSLSGEFIPVFEYASDSGTISATLNAGQRPFAYTAPSGFKALCTQNLPTPTIGATTATQAGKFFNTLLWTSNAAVQSITGAGFQPDLVWVKSRTSNSANEGWHHLVDAVRGTGTGILSTNSNSSQYWIGTNYSVTALNADGFSSGIYDGLNGNPMVTWLWKANGSGSSNTSGSITSTVSANTTSGFSIVTYTGVGGVSTVGHGLGVAPSMMIFKDRDVNANWPVYHKTLGNTSACLLNDTSASTATANWWNNTNPTSSVFTIGSNENTNLSKYVVYCFAEVAGFSVFGSYTGNGSADGPFVYCGFRPKYFLWKPSSAVGSWAIYDSVRNTYNVEKDGLFANLASTESDFGSSYYVDFVSNGLKIRGSGAGFNGSGETIIFMAFAESPFKYSLAR